mmetsp:Transcript_5047/g.16128  ORF Transcript_5047/g.16128 Transcript_5047/m.16128 type:complete len:122 (-) Transcript_5047:195-560(-)
MGFATLPPPLMGGGGAHTRIKLGMGCLVAKKSITLLGVMWSSWLSIDRGQASLPAPPVPSHELGLSWHPRRTTWLETLKLRTGDASPKDPSGLAHCTGTKPPKKQVIVSKNQENRQRDGGK